MDKHGPIVIIEDNAADQRILEEIFKSLPYENELKFFTDGALALEFLNSTEEIPFIIISDINMPKLNGFELKARIQENADLSLKCVPFLFLSSGADKKSVSDAYSMSVQGFFQKPMEIEKLEALLGKIIEYWKECIAPGDYHQRTL